MISWLNAIAAVLALSLACLAGVNWSSPRSAPTQSLTVDAAKLEWAKTKDGRPALVDASGVVVPVRNYRRIVSGSNVSDALLLELAEPDRVVAFTQYSETSPLGPHRYAGKAHINALDNLEQLLSLQPDLLLLNTHGDPAKVARLRQAGLQVFNLGEMRGLSTFLDNARTVSALLGAPERGRIYVDQFMAKMRAIDQGLSKSEHFGAIYLVVFSGKFFGGGRHTSYDDVMRHAGLKNLAAQKFEGWPEYDPEEILELDPEFIVTRENMGATICSQAGLERLQACRTPETHIVELPAPMISDAGAGMLPAALRLRKAIDAVALRRP